MTHNVLIDCNLLVATKTRTVIEIATGHPLWQYVQEFGNRDPDKSLIAGCFFSV